MDENARLQELKDFEILDTPADFKLDEITRIASLVCETPIALISLVDEKRQWFKSKVGLEVNETPRDISFCTHAICQNEIFVVEDAKQDVRFKENILVTGDPRIAFYAGYPLTTTQGNNIGTICVIDRKTKQLNELQIEILRNLSKQVINYFELYKSKKDLEKIKTSLIQSEKLSSTGQLAAGIAHEINNPSTIVIGRISLISEKMSKLQIDEATKNEVKKDLDSALEAIYRITTIVSSLRDFSECSDNELFGHSNLLQIVNTVLFMLEQKLRDSNIQIVLNINKNLIINCKMVNLAHAFFNIIMNSYEAVLNNDDKWIKIEASIDDVRKKVVIQFVDSGSGVDKKIVEYLMQPFVSTKEYMNRPKGFGLSIACGIIYSNNGELTYQKDAKNTTFVVTLPLEN